MYQYSFTAARAEQHRAALMTAADQARDCRRATAGRTRTRKLRSWPMPRRLTWTIHRQPAQLRESF